MDELSPKQIQQMISMLQKMLPENEEEADTDTTPSKDEFASNNRIKTVNRKPQQTENKFDKMMEANLHKEDVEIDKKLRKYDPTPRVRDFKPIKVQCRVCGKSDHINPVLLHDTPDRYKCNNCSRSAG